MKKLCLILFLCLVAFGVEAGNIVTFFKAGGPDTWYYGSGLTDADFYNYTSYAAGENEGDDVAVAIGGAITKVRFRHGTTTGGTTAALLITTTDNVKVRCQAITITDQATAWEEWTLDSPITGVSSGTVYRVYLVPGTTTRMSHAGTTGGFELGGAFVPADICAETSYTAADHYQHAVGLYCD